MNMTDIEYIIEKVDKILVQVTATNGRVTRLEDDLKELEYDLERTKTHLNIIKGRDKTLWYVIIAIVTVAGFFISHFISKI